MTTVFTCVSPAVAGASAARAPVKAIEPIVKASATAATISARSIDGMDPRRMSLPGGAAENQQWFTVPRRRR
jgi:hypothetical protein